LKVLRGEPGFCFGVQRAIDILTEASLRYKRIISLGPVVHNRYVISQLASRGIIGGGVDDLREASPVAPNPSGDVLAITAHGVPPEIYRKVYEKGIAVIDTTCPTVRKAQAVVESLAQDGTPVVIFGNSYHTEVKALVARNRKAWVAEDPFKLDERLGNVGVGLVSQTTKPLDRYIDFFQGMKELNPEVPFRYYQTICKSVVMRIRKAEKVSQNVELMLVIGDKMSANTKNLLSVCSGITEAHLIESKDDIDESWLRGKKIIGITSGTSTPMNIIEEVEKFLEGFNA